MTTYNVMVDCLPAVIDLVKEASAEGAARWTLRTELLYRRPAQHRETWDVFVQEHRPGNGRKDGITHFEFASPDLLISQRPADEAEAEEFAAEYNQWLREWGQYEAE